MLQNYSEKPIENWRSKDAAVYLVISCVSKGQTQKHGVTQSSELVSLPQFTREHILPELLRPNGNSFNTIKSTLSNTDVVSIIFFGVHFL